MNTVRVVLCAIAGAASSFLVAQENEATKETTLPPEVEQLYARYEASIATLQNPLLELRQSYLRKLEELKSVSQAQGDLAGVVAIQDELKQQAEAGPGIGSRLASLAAVQKIYHENAVKIENRVNPERIRIEKAYQSELEAMITKLTQEGKIEEALQSQKRLEASNVRLQEWQRLSAEWDRRHASMDFAFSWPMLRQMIQ